MSKFILRWVVVTGVILLVARAVPGFHVYSWKAAAAAAFGLGALNLAVRPLVAALMLPPMPYLMALVVLALNTLFLRVLGAILAGFYVDGFGPCLAGAAAVTFVVCALGAFAAPRVRVFSFAAFTGKIDRS
jgi:putative membrane protein